MWPVRELLLQLCSTPVMAQSSVAERQDGRSEGLICSSFVVFGVYVSVILCNFLIKEILCSEAVLLSTAIETCNKDGRKLFMSALFEEAVACNYRCFSSFAAKTTNKCSCVTWRGVTEKPLLVSLFVCVGDHMTWSFLSLCLPSILRASSAFEVAMWKPLATNPNKYNNRVISSLPQ